MSDERDEAEPIELGYIEDLGDMISVQPIENYQHSEVTFLMCPLWRYQQQQQRFDVCEWHNIQQIVDDVKKQLGIPYAKVISESFDRPNIFYSIFNAENMDRFEHVKEYLSKYRSQSVIIYGRIPLIITTSPK